MVVMVVMGGGEGSGRGGREGGKSTASGDTSDTSSAITACETSAGEIVGKWGVACGQKWAIHKR